MPAISDGDKIDTMPCGDSLYHCDIGLGVKSLAASDTTLEF